MPKHGVLINTRIARPLIERHHFIAASPEHCSLTKQRTGSQASLWVNHQVRQLLQFPLKLRRALNSGQCTIATSPANSI